MSDRMRVPQATKTGYVYVDVWGVFDFSYRTSTTRRGRVQGAGGEICPALCACEPELVVFLGYEEC